jgi:hypothetical protein
MSKNDKIVAFRPAALPAVGFRVDIHDFGNLWLVLLFQHRAIASQTIFTEKAEAESYARDLAADHGCISIHHNHSGCRCAVCRSDLVGIVPCLNEES